jgi:orotidine-5'-phosphate decarboxylase
MSHHPHSAISHGAPVYWPAVTARPPFIDQLQRAIARNDSLFCVGLDPLPEKMPASYARSPRGVLEFLCAIVDATADRVCAFKPQIAHFAAIAAEPELGALIAHIHGSHPDIPVILDAKRGDIGSTAERYAVEAFDRYGADAVTVNPYLGRESLEPFLRRTDRGVVIVCRTSNADNELVQGHPAGDPSYLRVARAAAEWNTHRNVMLVAGATYPQELAQIRAAAPAVPLLLPGIGSQGGDLAAAVTAGLDACGSGVVVASSRAVTYASGGADFAPAAAEAAEKMRLTINEIRRHQHAGS